MAYYKIVGIERNPLNDCIYLKTDNESRAGYPIAVPRNFGDNRKINPMWKDLMRRGGDCIDCSIEVEGKGCIETVVDVYGREDTSFLHRMERDFTRISV